MARRWLTQRAAEPNLVSVCIAVRNLTHAVRIRFPVRGCKSPISNLRDYGIEVIDEERVRGVPSVFRVLHNVHVAVLRNLPHGLCFVRKECGWGAHQAFVPS